MPLLIEANIKIPSFTKAEYEVEKDNIPPNTVFIITDDNKEADKDVTENKN